MVFLNYPGLVITLYDGSVNMLVVESSAVGSTAAGVSVGISWRNLQRIAGSVIYDGDQGLWRSAEEPGIWYELARPLQEGEEPIDPPLVAEQYEVLDPAHSVVRRIYVM